MLFKYNPPNNTVTTVFGPDNQLMWNVAIWNRSRMRKTAAYSASDDEEEVEESIFYLLNKYLAALSPDKNDALARLYNKAFDDILSISDPNALDGQLYLAIEEIQSIVNWYDFVAFCDGEDIDTSIGIKNSLGEKEQIETSYFTRDYQELVYLSIWIKLIFPIWGQYYAVLKDVLSPELTLLHAIGLTLNTQFIELSCYKKLETYVSAIVKKQINQSKYSICSAIGGDKIPEYILAMVFWKKIVIFDSSHRDKSIICDVFALVADRCKRIQSGGPNTKKLVNPSGEEVDVGDSVKVTAARSALFSTMVNYACQNVNSIIVKRGIDVTNDLKLRMLQQIEGMPIKNYHQLIVDLLVHKQMGHCVSSHLRYLEVINLIAACAAYCHTVGYTSLATVLSTAPSDQDMSRLVALNQKPQQIIPEALKMKIESKYSAEEDYFAAMAFIDNSAKMIIAYDWNGDVSSLKLELATIMAD